MGQDGTQEAKKSVVGASYDGKAACGGASEAATVQRCRGYCVKPTHLDQTFVLTYLYASLCTHNSHPYVSSKCSSVFCRLSRHLAVKSSKDVT